MQKFSSGKQPSPDRNPGEDIPHLWPILYTLDIATHNVVIKKALFMIPGESCRNKTRGLKKAPAAYSPPPGAGGKHHDLGCLAQILMHMVQRRWSPGQPGRPRAVSTWLHCSPGPAATVLQTCCCSYPGGQRICPRGRMPTEWDLELTSGWLWSPHKRPFQAKCEKKMS